MTDCPIKVGDWVAYQSLPPGGVRVGIVLYVREWKWTVDPCWVLETTTGQTMAGDVLEVRKPV